MRLPGRIHITWRDANTLQIDTDAGTQTRLLHFGAAAATAATAPSWQGQSVAQWEFAPGGRGAPRTGNLKVVTTNLRAGYVRKNGAPHSDKAVVTEYFDLNTIPNGDTWLTITTKVEDPVYFARPYITTTDFKKLPERGRMESNALFGEIGRSDRSRRSGRSGEVPRIDASVGFGESKLKSIARTFTTLPLIARRRQPAPRSHAPAAGQPGRQSEERGDSCRRSSRAV